MPSSDDSGSNKPPKSPPAPADATTPEGPSPIDAMPAAHVGAEFVEPEALSVDPPPEALRYRMRRLLDPALALRLRRRFEAAVPEEDALDRVIERLLHADSATSLPDETMFPRIYNPATAKHR